MTKGYINIIVIDYCKLIRSEQMVQYVSAVANATTIGRLLGRYLKEYVRDVSQVRLVGHSMGAQIMSYAAKEFGSGRLRLTGTPKLRFPRSIPSVLINTVNTICM